MHKEFQFWQFIAERLERSQPVMLLVVAESSGSSPGRQGYKMAVAADGELMGSIGGGVMEVNLVEQSRRMLSAASPALQKPARSKGETLNAAPSLQEPARSKGETLNAELVSQTHRKNVPDSSGMICSGKQTVIFKMLSRDDIDDVRRAVDSLSERRRDRLIITGAQFNVGPPEGGTLNEGGNQNEDFHFEKITESDFVYQERLGYKNILYIVGGGHCALALSELMSKMDFQIHIFDDRPELNTIAKNRFADEISIIESYEKIGDHITAGLNAYVVVMTLGYTSDEIVIRKLLGRSFKYFGVLGSKAKMRMLLNNLKTDGFSPEFIDAIHTPIGLPINSHTPEEIAVSIAAEIISVKNR
jgi:xanthine dehydrogenase accessory factor